MLFMAIVHNSLFMPTAIALNSNPKIIQQRLKALSVALNIKLFQIKQLDKKELPAPFDYLLTQPLLTLGIKNFYKRTPVVRVLYAVQDKNHDSYTRVITMLLDRNRERDNATIAQKLNQEAVVELALISIHLNELPHDLVQDILTTTVPFGALLKKQQIATHSIEQYYFSTPCNEALTPLLKCNLNTAIYGRTNTIVRNDNDRIVAQVIELLPTLAIDN